MKTGLQIREGANKNAAELDLLRLPSAAHDRLLRTAVHVTSKTFGKSMLGATTFVRKSTRGIP